MLQKLGVQPHHIDAAKVFGDFASLGAIVATFMDYVPKLSALVGLVYILIRVWETDTMQKFVMYIKEKYNGKKEDG